MTRRFCVAVLSLLFSANVGTAQSVASRRVERTSSPELVHTIAPRLRELGVPGITWAIVRGDTVETGAAGVRDLKTGAAMRPDLRVQIGSVTKTVLATGVLMLATRGRLSLDQPLATYLPSLSIDNPWERESPITVRHLLDHTAGLGDAHLWQVFSLRTSPDLPLRDAVVRPGAKLRVQTRPGSRFSYSNTGYLLLGLLIEARTGERYETYLDRELLRPLGMMRSTFTWQTQVGPQGDTTMAMGHFEGGGRQPSYGIAVRPAAQFATTSADMARFARFLMSDGRVDGRILVDSTFLRAMGRPTTTDAARAGLSTGYGLGMQTRERWGMRPICHQGNIGTFRAMLCILPDQQRAFFASYNSDPEGVPFDRVDSLLMSHGSSRPSAEPAVVAADTRITGNHQNWTGWYIQRPARFEQFAYLDAIGSLVRVTAQGDTLTLAPIGGTTRRLVSLDGSLWRQSDRVAASHVALTTGDGLIISDGQRTLQREPGWMVWLRWGSAAIGVLSVLGMIAAGAARLIRQRKGQTRWREPMTWPLAAISVLIVGGSLMWRQSFLAIGDPTLGSNLVAVGSALLVLSTAAAAIRLIFEFRMDAARTGYRPAPMFFVTLGALQWLVVLMWWGLLPLRIWR